MRGSFLLDKIHIMSLLNLPLCVLLPMLVFYLRIPEDANYLGDGH